MAVSSSVNPARIGIVLAAGRSSRLGSPKALARLDGKTFVERAVESLRVGASAEVCVVVGPPHARAIEAALPGVTVVHNPSPERGMLSSLQIGLAFARERGADTVLFSLVDHPRVRPDTVEKLLAGWSGSRRRALRPVFGGRGGHPVVLSADAVTDLLAAAPTASIRDVLGALDDLEVDDPGVVDDIDVPADLAALESGRR